MPRVALLRSRFPDVRLEKEARSLTKAGFNAEIIAWDRKRGASVESDATIETKTLEIAAPPSSILVPLILPIWMGFAFTRLLRSKVDTVHAADFDACLPALLAARIRNIPLVYDIYDLYAETMDFPFLKNCLRRVIGGIDGRLMDRAGAIVLPDESRLKQIGEGFSDKVVYVNNAPEEKPEDRELNLATEKHDDFVVFYGGEVAPDRCLHIAIKAVKGLAGVKLRIVGPSSIQYANQLEELASNAPNVDLQLSWHQPEYILNCVRESDALFAVYDPIIPNNRYASPNKLFEAMMCHKPIIVNAGTSMDVIVQREKCGLVIDSLEPLAFKKAILELRDDPKLRETLGENGRTAFEGRYSWSIMEHRLVELHSRLAE